MSAWGSDHVERVVERRDGRDAAQHRRARGIDAARLAVRSDVAGVDLAVVADRHLAGEQVDVVGAADLVERVLEAETRLGGDQERDLLAPPGQDLGRVGKNPLAVVAGQLGLVGGADLEGFSHLCGTCAGHRGDDGACVGIAHLDLGVGIDELARYAHLLVRLHGKLGHLGLLHALLHRALHLRSMGLTRQASGCRCRGRPAHRQPRPPRRACDPHRACRCSRCGSCRQP